MKKCAKLKNLISSFLSVAILCSVNLADAKKNTNSADRAAFEFDSGLPWLNVSRPLTLNELRGKVVILDFWTYGCINCIHVLDDLKRLEKKYRNKLAVIGVHSPKFDNEKNIESLRNIVVRYEIEHPVISDVDFTIGRFYGMRAWPTQVVIDPAGETLGKVTGEGHYELLNSVINDLLAKHTDLLNTTPLPISLEKERFSKSLLAAPGKIALSKHLVAISDTLHHRIILADHSGRINKIVGGKASGYRDGAVEEARFSLPQGLAFAKNGLFVADTGNHLIRWIDLNTGNVKTVAGNGELDLPRFGKFNALRVKLRSPWGLAIKGRYLYIAMAGTHQIWRLNATAQQIEHFAGSRREGLRDGSLQHARFSQPSGLSVAGKWLFIADAEDSAIRRIDLEQAHVETIIGTGLFDFGDRDGSFQEAELQHVLGVGAIDAKHLVIADTYNHKIKWLDLVQREITTLAGTGQPGSGKTPPQLNEPGGLAVLDNLILVADTNNHRIMKYDLKTRAMEEWKLIDNLSSAN